MEFAGRLQSLAGRTDVKIAILVIGEVLPRDGAVVTPGFVPDRDVRLDAALDQPTEHLPGAVEFRIGVNIGDRSTELMELLMQPLNGL